MIDIEALERRLNVPKEIRARGAAAVGHYLERLEMDAQKLNESRIIILGEKGAGKTCIARRLVSPVAPMTEPEESTAGVDTTTWHLFDDKSKVRIWDFAGHTVTHAVHQFFLSERCLYILVYDGRSEQRNRMDYWLDHMKNYGGSSEAIILVNQHDKHQIDIPINSLREKYAIHSIHYFSIKDDANELEAFRTTVIKAITENPCWNRQEIPGDYYQVKSDLEALFEVEDEGKEHIELAEFEAIASKHGIASSQQLLKDLNAFGISLWYEELVDYDTLVLNPEWISHGVYQIINWVANQKQYSLVLKDFTQVFRGDDAKRFGEEHHEFLFSLMKHYELAYESDCGADRTLIIPHLLPKDRPDTLPQFDVGESLMLKYQAEQPLPPHTISRFIVRHNEAIKKDGNRDLAWRAGVILVDEQNKNTIALVREDDRSISISVKGPTKTEFISQLRDTMDDIFDSYKSDKPDLLYKVVPYGEISAEVIQRNPVWLPDREIVNLVDAHRPYYEHNSRRDLDLNPTYQQYNIHAQKVVVGGSGHQLIDGNVITHNFKDCNFTLQGDLNSLAEELKDAGFSDEVKQLESAGKALEKVEDCQNPDELKKSGAARQVERVVNQLSDEKSALHKAVKATKTGVGIAQDIAKGYNSVAEWIGAPQVPKVFLKK